MKVFEIIFILLLLIPVALLMRYFITRLSAETPKQVYTKREIREGGPAPVAWLRRRNQELDEEAYRGRKKKKKRKRDIPEEPAEQGTEPAATAAALVRDPDFVPRERAQIRRSERVPFSQVHHDGSAQRQPQRPPQRQAQRPERPSQRTAPKEEKPAAQWPPKKPAQRLVDRSTQRITVHPEEGENLLSAEERLQQRREAANASAKKKQPRSEQSPSKRQKRNNRKRARKRELNRRDKEKQ